MVTRAWARYIPLAAIKHQPFQMVWCTSNFTATGTALCNVRGGPTPKLMGVPITDMPMPRLSLAIVSVGVQTEFPKICNMPVLVDIPGPQTNLAVLTLSHALIIPLRVRTLSHLPQIAGKIALQLNANAYLQYTDIGLTTCWYGNLTFGYNTPLIRTLLIHWYGQMVIV